MRCAADKRRQTPTNADKRRQTPTGWCLVGGSRHLAGGSLRSVGVWSAADLTHREVCRRLTPTNADRAVFGRQPEQSAFGRRQSAFGRRLVGVVGVCQWHTARNASLGGGGGGALVGFV